MREIFTYGSVGGALGNQCFYPEKGSSGFVITDYRLLKPLRNGRK